MHRKPIDHQNRQSKTDSKKVKSDKKESYETKTYVFHKVELDAIYDKDNHKKHSALSVASHDEQK